MFHPQQVTCEHKCRNIHLYVRPNYLFVTAHGDYGSIPSQIRQCVELIGTKRNEI